MTSPDREQAINEAMEAVAGGFVEQIWRLSLDDEPDPKDLIEEAQEVISLQHARAAMEEAETDSIDVLVGIGVQAVNDFHRTEGSEAMLRVEDVNVQKVAGGTAQMAAR